MRLATVTFCLLAACAQRAMPFNQYVAKLRAQESELTTIGHVYRSELARGGKINAQARQWVGQYDASVRADYHNWELLGILDGKICFQKDSLVTHWREGEKSSREVREYDERIRRRYKLFAEAAVTTHPDLPTQSTWPPRHKIDDVARQRIPHDRDADKMVETFCFPRPEIPATAKYLSLSLAGEDLGAVVLWSIDEEPAATTDEPTTD